MQATQVQLSCRVLPGVGKAMSVNIFAIKGASQDYVSIARSADTFSYPDPTFSPTSFGLWKGETFTPATSGSLELPTTQSTMLSFEGTNFYPSDMSEEYGRLTGPEQDRRVYVPHLFVCFG
jgi:hypothetical protein